MSLFVGNISKNVRQYELEDQFNKFGKCSIKQKVTYRKITPLAFTCWFLAVTGKRVFFDEVLTIFNLVQDSFAFIEFESERDAEDAREELQGKNMGGLEIAIEWSKRSGRFSAKDSHRPPP
jgi:RNA recognition motif-containing protein